MDNLHENEAQGGDRRRQERIAAAVVTELSIAGAPHMAMLHDLSSTGALVLTRARFAVGDKVELKVHLGAALEETVVSQGEVVRVQDWAAGESFWPLSIAVRFDQPTTGYEAALRAIAARQEELGLLPTRG